jgi:alkaline phosphatase
VFSFGRYSENFKGVYDNTEIFDKLMAIIGK